MSLKMETLGEDREAQANPIQIVYSDIDYNVPKQVTGIKGMCPCFSKGPEERIHIINNISGVIEPGAMTAILGPSGSGKTTMLNILSGRIPKKDYSGSVTYNGAKVSALKFKKYIGYVPQADILAGALTVTETMQFVADLQLPHLSKSKRDAIVNNTIDELGLRKCAKTYVGYVGEDALNSGIKRGISGGERKRLSVGLELIKNPSLIFLDEPTTGLDAFSALSVIKTLQKLAKKGKTIVFTIHQPSSEIMDLFDKMLLISRGYTVYNGRFDKALSYFKSVGYECPKHEDPGDYFLRCCQDPQAKLAGTIAGTLDSNQVTLGEEDAVAQKLAHAQSMGTLFDQSKFKKKSVKKGKTPAKLDTSDTKRQASFFTQVSKLLQRNMRNLAREPNATRASLMQFVIIAVVMGLIFLQMDDSNTAATQDRPGSLFFSCIFIMMMGLLQPFNSFATESKVFMRDYFAGLYGTPAYYFGKVLTETIVFLVLVMVYNTIFYWMVGYKTTVEAFFIFCLIMIIINNISIAFGTLIIVIFPSPAVALTVFPLFFIPLMMFSGFYLDADSTPVYFIWVEYLSYLKYGFRALMRNELDDTSFYCTQEEINNSGGVCPFTGPSAGRQILDFFSMLGVSSVWIDVAILCGFLVGIHAMAVVILAFKARRQNLKG